MAEPTMTRAAFAQSIKAKYPVYAQIPDEELATKMLAKYPVYAAQIQPDAPAPPASTAAGTVQRVAGAVAPTVGGMVGGMVGGVPGAAIGGAAGEGYKQIAEHAGEILPAVRDVARNLVEQPAATLKGAAEGIKQGVQDTGLQAGLNAVGEGIGQGIVKVAGPAAKWLMGEAGKPSMTLAREFPDLSETMIEHALTYTKGGLAQARTLLSATKATANAALDKAATNGAKVPLTAATSGLQKTFDELAVNSSDPVGALSKLAALEKRIGLGRAKDLTMREADALKSSLQREASALYKQIQAGLGSKSAAIEMVAKADMAQALNAAIEDIATKAGAAGYKAANSAAQDLIGATRAISRRLLLQNGPVSKAITDLATPAAAGTLLAGGTGAVIAAGTTIAGKAATTPGNLSRIALHLSNPSVQAFLRQMPKPVLAALSAHLWPGTEEAAK